MKALRQLLRVSWKTSAWVLQKAETKPNLLQAIKTYGHVLRKEGSCIEKEIIQGQRRRGRLEVRRHDNIMKWTGLSGDSQLRSVEDRTQWQKVHEAVNPRNEED